MRDDKTERGYPLPSMSNCQEEDIPRLRKALNAIDADITKSEAELGGIAAALDAINGETGGEE